MSRSLSTLAALLLCGACTFDDVSAGRAAQAASLPSELPFESSYPSPQPPYDETPITPFESVGATAQE